MPRGACMFGLQICLTAAPALAQRSPSPLHTVEIGSGSTTIVVLHGGPGLSHDYLRPEWDQLAEVGRVIYYDQRGSGRSTIEGPYAWEQHVEDLDNLLRATHPKDR